MHEDEISWHELVLDHSDSGACAACVSDPKTIGQRVFFIGFAFFRGARKKRLWWRRALPNGLRDDSGNREA
jgi:hypothetical protein